MSQQINTGHFYRQDAYQLYQEGEIGAQQALDYIARQLDSIADSLGPLEEAQKQLRNQAGEIVERLGGKAEVAGFGSFAITAPSVTVTYDNKLMDRLVAALTGEGQTEVARRITACRREGSRAGSLRISRVKAGQGKE